MSEILSRAVVLAYSDARLKEDVNTASIHPFDFAQGFLEAFKKAYKIEALYIIPRLSIRFKA